MVCQTMSSIINCIIWSDDEPQEVEYCQECDHEIDEDIPSYQSHESQDCLLDAGDSGDNLDSEQVATVWWLVVFTCVLQALHNLSSRTVQWLLKFLGLMLKFLGRYSHKVAGIAKAFLTTLYIEQCT